MPGVTKYLKWTNVFQKGYYSRLHAFIYFSCTYTHFISNVKLLQNTLIYKPTTPLLGMVCLPSVHINAETCSSTSLSISSFPSFLPPIHHFT